MSRHPRDVALDRALGILHRFAEERTGWRALLYGRWRYPQEPLRNDAANFVRECGYQQLLHDGDRLVGDHADA